MILSSAAEQLIARPAAYIDGKWTDGEGVTFSTLDPTTEQPLAHLEAVTEAQADLAIGAGRAAFDGGEWSRLRPVDRANVLHRLADAMETNAEVLAQLVVAEVGSPITLARGMQVAMPIANFRWMAEAAARGPRDGYEEALPLHHSPVTSASILVREPVGVVAALTAYNYPFNLLAWKVGGALASGCPVVLMPSPQAVLCTIAFVRLVEAAGFPPGAVNLVYGGSDVGRQIVADPRIDMVSFTGSDAVGAEVMALAALTVKKVVLELGGKSPNIVLRGADPTTVVGPSVLRFTRNAGQGCGATTRTFVPAEQHDTYAAALVDEMERLVVGDPWDERTDVGPLISGPHRDRVQGYVARAEAVGATVLTGGGRPVRPETGYFFEPTLVAGVDVNAEIAQEELFGPVGVLLPYDDIDDLVARANATRFALNANIWGSTGEALQVARRIRSGTVTINGGGGMRPDAPWGGPRHSGVGREMGEDGLREFFEVKHIQWPVDAP
jgi:aldehyde dehydrogenase (NAD+)